MMPLTDSGDLSVIDQTAARHGAGQNRMVMRQVEAIVEAKSECRDGSLPPSAPAMSNGGIA